MLAFCEIIHVHIFAMCTDTSVYLGRMNTSGREGDACFRPHTSLTHVRLGVVAIVVRPLVLGGQTVAERQTTAAGARRPGLGPHVEEHIVT